MKKFLHLFTSLALMCIAFAVHADDYTMPTKDGFIEEKAVDGTLTFYDMGGPSGNTKGYYAGYVRFVPANEGDQLVITFEELDLGGVAKLYGCVGTVVGAVSLQRLGFGHWLEGNGDGGHGKGYGIRQHCGDDRVC